MTETKAAYHHGDLRNALIDTATDLVRAAGAPSFSLRDAAKQLGVSANATYRHFSSKAELLTAVAIAGRDQLALEMRRAVESAGKKERARFDAAGRAYVSFGIAQPELYRLMYGRDGICRSNEPADSYRILSEVLEGLVRTGVVDASSCVDGELRLWTLLHGFTSLVIEGAKPYAADARLPDAIDDVLEFALRGLGATPSRAKRRRA